MTLSNITSLRSKVPQGREAGAGLRLLAARLGSRQPGAIAAATSGAGRCNRGVGGRRAPMTSLGPRPSLHLSDWHRRRSQWGHGSASTCRYRDLAEGAPAWLGLRRQALDRASAGRAFAIAAVNWPAYAGAAPSSGHGTEPRPPFRLRRIVAAAESVGHRPTLRCRSRSALWRSATRRSPPSWEFGRSISPSFLPLCVGRAEGREGALGAIQHYPSYSAGSLVSASDRRGGCDEAGPPNEPRRGTGRTSTGPSERTHGPL